MLYKLLIFRAYLDLKRLGKGCFQDPGADLLAALGEGPHVLGVELLQALGDALLELVGRQEFAEGLCGGGEAAWHADARCGEAADHLAERGILPADLLQVGHAEVFEPRYMHWDGILAFMPQRRTVFFVSDGTGIT